MKERDTISACDLLRPGTGKLSGVDRLLRGTGMLLVSTFRAHMTIATLVEAHAGRRPEQDALTVSWASVLCARATLALARKFSVSGFWPDVRHHKVTVFCSLERRERGDHAGRECTQWLS